MRLVFLMFTFVLFYSFCPYADMTGLEQAVDKANNFSILEEDGNVDQVPAATRPADAVRSAESPLAAPKNSSTTSHPIDNSFLRKEDPKGSISSDGAEDKSPGELLDEDYSVVQYNSLDTSQDRDGKHEGDPLIVVENSTAPVSREDRHRDKVTGPANTTSPPESVTLPGSHPKVRSGGLRVGDPLPPISPSSLLHSTVRAQNPARTTTDASELSPEYRPLLDTVTQRRRTKPSSSHMQQTLLGSI